MRYYAVRRGRRVGIYTSWTACKDQVHGYPGAQYKSFSTKSEAEAYVASPLILSDQSPAQAVKANSSSDRYSGFHVWVDGACVQKGKETLHIGWAYVVYQEGEELYRDSGNDVPPQAHRHRNVAGEIMAVRKAIGWCQWKGIKEITIHYDYQGLASWVRGEWQVKTSFTQEYARTIRESKMVIHWEKVKAHSGEPRNEMVDKLARKAALERKNEENNQ